MAPVLKIAPPQTKAEKVTRTTVDTILITPELVSSWLIPPFQRPLRVNEKVRQLAVKIAEDGGVMPGIMTLGILGRQKFLLDGQHRREAFLMSGCKEGFVDVRLHHFENMADMGEEFVNLNSQLVRMRPDDIVRGLEESIPAVAYIRKECPFVGYDQIRRGTNAPLVSMSALLRCWNASSKEAPQAGAAGVAHLAKELLEDDARQLVAFVKTVYAAWGRDPEYFRLWSNLNLTLCAWLYRRIVLSSYSAKTKAISRELWTKCMMALSADHDYIDWLLGRNLNERDRSPCYNRIKATVARRLEQEAGTGKKALLPAPPWAHSSARGRGKV